MDEWRDSIPEGSEGRFERFNDLESVLKTYVETDSEISRRVRIPTEDSAPEDVAKFYGKLGRPETQDGYNPVDAEDQGLKALVENFVGSAHKANLTTSQFDALQESLVQTYNDLSEAAVAADPRSGWAGETKELLGEKFDAVVGQAQEAAKALLDENEVAALVETGLTDHPYMVKLFGEKLYPMIAEGQVPGDKGASAGQESSYNSHLQEFHEAKAEALKAQESDPRGEGNDFRKAHGRMVAAREALYKMGVSKIPNLDFNGDPIDDGRMF